jgi:electron transport complex protein RnfA
MADNHPHILLVEDEEAHAGLIQRAFKANGHRVAGRKARLTVVGQLRPNRLFDLARPFMSVLNINCVVLAITLLALQRTEQLFFALGLTAGYALSLVVVAEFRERLAARQIPRFMQGAPIVLLSMGIVSLALQGVIG